MIYYDAYYYGKEGHEPCQDYAIALPSIQEVRLSDGCGSCSHSDIGARLVCITDCQKTNLLQILTDNSVLQKEDLYATYLKIKNIDGEPRLFIKGDGFTINYDFNTKKYDYEYINYTNNAPEYPIYSIFPDLKSEWQKQFPNNRMVRTTICYDNVDYTSTDNKYKTLYISKPNVFLISSDGLDSFVDESGNKIHHSTVISKILEFKNLNGEFLKRRMIAFRKECKKLGWKNLDDVSIAGVAYV